jgi:CDP-diacylglycerol---glycerol-3-phosphate 3-phosphatidyltransferase
MPLQANKTTCCIQEMSTTISDPHQPQEALPHLKMRWAAFTFAGIIVLGSVALLLYNLLEPKFALRWLPISVMGMLYLSRILWCNLDQNHRPGETNLLPTLGPGNSLTLLRGLLLACLAGFILVPKPVGLLAWAPAIIYTLAIAVDFLDGYAARVSNHVTRLGETLDMSLDGVGILIASVLAIQYGTLPAWYLAVPLARFLFLAGIGFRERGGLAVYELNPSLRRRAFAGLQMGFLSTMLWPVFTPPGTTVAAFVFAFPFLVGFTLDWFVVSGLLRQNHAQQPGTAYAFLITYAPITLRLAVLVVLSTLIGIQIGNYLDQSVQSIASVSTPNATVEAIQLGFEILVLFLLVFGAAGRIAAIAGLLLLGIHQIYTGLILAQYILIFVYVAILYLGTGKYSMWKPEDSLIFKQAGQAPAQAVEYHHPTRVRQ